MKTLTIGNKYTKTLCLLLIILCMAFIFMMSAQTADSSHAISEVVKEWIGKIIRFSDAANIRGSAAAKSVETVIRKLAHMTEFMSLGVLCILYALHFRKSVRFCSISAFLATSLYGVSDEIHQLFVKGRACMWQDMLIDSLSGAVGIALVLIFLYIRRRKNESIDIG